MKLTFFLNTFIFFAFAFSSMSIVLGCHSSGKGSSSKLIDIPRKADGSVDYDKLPTISFRDTKFDFGRIPKNSKVHHTFIFTNRGHTPLVISDVVTSCGCTSPTWPRHIVDINATDSIIVEYNSEGRPGAFNKGITVTANTYPNQTVLAIKGITDN